MVEAYLNIVKNKWTKHWTSLGQFEYQAKIHQFRSEAKKDLTWLCSRAHSCNFWDLPTQCPSRGRATGASWPSSTRVDCNLGKKIILFFQVSPQPAHDMKWPRNPLHWSALPQKAKQCRMLKKQDNCEINLDWFSNVSKDINFGKTQKVEICQVVKLKQ